MNEVIEERYFFVMRRYPNGDVWCSAPKKIGQGPSTAKQKTKQAPAPIQVAEAPKTAKPLWGN